MLMRLRGDNGGEAPTFSAANFKLRDDKRRERRRRQGSNVSARSSAGSASGLGLPPMPLSPPGTNGVPPLPMSLGSPTDDDDPVARAKSALMAMRRGSDSSSGTPAIERRMELQIPSPPPQGEEDDGENGVISPGLPTPTTIVSPPSPEQRKKEDDGGGIDHMDLNS
jgi:cytokinesis protein